jgi:hypothetical protein
MHHLFRLRHLLILAAVLSVGLVPLYANQQNLGAAGSFAVLADDIDTTGGTLDVNAVVNGGAGNVAANTYTPDASAITADGSIAAAGDPATPPVLAAALATGQTIIALAQTVGTDPTMGTGVLDGLNLTPGIYYLPTPASLGAGQTLTLTGSGEYVIATLGTATFGAGSSVNLAGGAAAANVTWICNLGLTATTSTLNGSFLLGGLGTLNGGTLNGKLLAAGNADVTITGGVTVNDAGTAPTVAVSNIAGTAPSGSGDGSSALSPLVVTEGDVLTFSVSGSDPTDGSTVTLDSAGDAGIAGYTDGLPVGPANLILAGPTYTPPVNGPQTSTTFPVTYTTTDASGAICSQTVYIHVNALPDNGAPTNVSGQAPFASGAGTVGDPFIACEDDTFSFDFTGTDDDVDGPLTVAAAVSPASANFSFTPANPQTEADGSVTVNTSFTPDDVDAGQTFTVTFTTTDSNGETTVSTVFIQVSSLPEFAAPFTDAGQDALTACVGQTLQYDLSATDPDGGALTLLVDGAPVGGAHNPNALGADTLGPNDEDVLNFGSDTDGDGDDSTANVRFSWTPIPGDEGLHTLTYTAVNQFGCEQTTTVNVIVTNPPTVSAASNGPVTEGETLVVCPGDPLSVALSGVDTDGDVVSLAVTGQPGSATFTPALPASGAGAANTTLAYTPTVGEAGDTFTVTVTATDDSSASTLPGAAGIVQCDATATLSFVIRVAEVPVITVAGSGATVVNAGVINVCTGDPVAFRVRATDADGGDSVTLTQSGAPGLAVFTPGLPAVGNPVETNFAWTAGAAGQTVITFTATDSTGCDVTSTVTVNVSAVPTVTISNVTGAQSGNGTLANPYVVCVGATPAFQFTATGADTDVADLVTLSQVGLPTGATFTQTLPAQGNPVASTFSFSPSAGQGGQTFAVTLTATDNSAAACSASTTVNIRVSSLPVVTATPATLDVCEGDRVEYRIRATDADPGNVTIGVPTVVSSDQGEGAPQLTLVNTPTLPTAGNPVETVVTGTAPDVAINTTYTITYTVTDSDGCTATQVVTVNVQATQPTTVSLTQTPAGDIQVGQEVCYTATVRDNCPEPKRVAGVPVCFEVLGTTGNNTPGAGNNGGGSTGPGQGGPRGVTVITDANGEARYCFTPVFPGTVTVTAVIDFNGDCVADAGTTSATSNLTVPSPVQLGPGCYATGRGKVDVADPLFGTSPVPATFQFDVTPKRNNAFKGKVSFVVPAAGVGRRGNIKLSSTRIESMLCTEDATGVSAVIFGVGRITGHPEVTGTVRFRVDALDAGTAGIPGDRFTLTLLTPLGDILAGPVGGSLQFGRGLNRDDIKIRKGTRTR